jgi:hypothetical protein
VVQKSDDDVDRALAAFSAPSISYRNFAFGPSAPGEPRQTDPASGGFRLLVAAFPEAAELAGRALPPSAEAGAEPGPEQAPPAKNPQSDPGRSNAPAAALRPKGLAPNSVPLKVGPKFQTSSETHSTVHTDLAIGASVRQAWAPRAPDSSTDRTPLAEVFAALNVGRLPPENPAEGDQKLWNIFSRL